ncbi:MAG: glycosyl hydrolase, partial [Actinomycetota bacterium]
AAYQRRRSVRSFMGGGPGSGIHTTSDGGATWTKVTEGLPSSDLGKIGLAVTPADPSLVYATVEAAEESERGFYRSTTRGRSWERRSGYISGGTGPHYYQEIFASPIDAEKVYQVDVFVHVTTDGGKNFRNMEPGAAKHSDNHVVWIDPADGDHLLVGTDAGLYESFDDGGAWRHVSNLPVSQFYRVAVDNSVPFTRILGGAQDLGTLAGPSRTLQIDGVRNQDWWVPLGADGYHVAFDPDDPDTSYMEWQVGNVMRHDRRTMELTDIQPQPGPGEDPERWNWDTPIVISPHASNRIYVASHRVWRSDDRGDSWTAISPDLTTGANRYELPTGDRVWSVDGLYDHMAMSGYATITDVSESPVVEGLFYVGTDDGRVQIGEVQGSEVQGSDGVGDWRPAGELPGLPAEAFVNDVEACRHRPDAAFVAADDHKNGDYSPYLFETEDRGQTWRSIRGDLPDGIIVWKIEQDHINPDLLFVGAENGLYVSLDRGAHWHRLGAGPTGDGTGGSVPTISFRDLAIQRRDDDLVGATFGRGFYILDDYSPLRALTEEALAGPAALFPVRQAWRYVPYRPMQSAGQRTLGDTAWRAPNPEFGATITYHLADDIRSATKQRREDEKALDAAGDDVPFPGWDRLWAEHVETDPVIVLRIL